MKNLTVFKMFLEKYNKDKSLFAYLTDTEIEKINALPTFVKNIRPAKESLLDRVHYSWFIPFLNMYEEK